MGGHRARLQRRASGQYLDCVARLRSDAALGAADRHPGGADGAHPVRLPQLDRTGLPGPQNGRLEVAQDPPPGPHPKGARRGPPLAGAGDCHLAGRGLRHAPRGSGGAAPGPRAPAPASCRVDSGPASGAAPRVATASCSRAWRCCGTCCCAVISGPACGCGRRLAPTSARACARRTPAAPEPTRVAGAGPASHSSIALSTPRPARSSAPRGLPHRHFSPHGAFLPSHCR